MYWQEVLVVDQEILYMAIESDRYWILFDDTITVNMSMLWGSRVKLTW